MICQYCGQQLASMTTRCGECGASLTPDPAYFSEDRSPPVTCSANLAAFGKEILELVQDHVADDMAGEDDYDMLEIAWSHGLVEKVIYDPAKHGEIIDVEPGNEIFWWGGSGKDSQNVAGQLPATKEPR